MSKLKEVEIMKSLKVEADVFILPSPTPTPLPDTHLELSMCFCVPVCIKAIFVRYLIRQSVSCHYRKAILLVFHV